MPSGSHTSNLASSGMFARSSAKDGSGSSRASLVKIFSFSDLRLATSNFGPDSVLGRGRFGYVYKGWIDENILSTCKPGTGIAVAVKKLQQEGLLGRRLGEWLEEVNYLGRFCHPNLVKLIGYCLEDEHRLLVQEFMPHGSLERHLLRRDSHFQPLSWNLRMKVALGAAKGLAYLHSAEVQVIYRDFKASSILLDMDFSAKLSNFGLAIGGEKSHVSTREIMGSYGYEAPESISTGRRTAKSNIYSFGVVLLEMLSGRHAIEDYYPVLWARRYLRHKRKISRVMDPNLEGQYPRSGAHTIAALACDCLRVDAEKRPSMDAVVSILEKLQDADLKRAAEKHQESKGA